MNTIAEERRSSIAEQVARNRVVRIGDLSKHFGVSEVSIRRDLERLEQLGLLKRVHGGAVALPAPSSNGASPPRVSPEKERIGRAAAELIRPGDRLILDSGTTVLQVARSIPGDLLRAGNLTVITSSLPIVHELGAWKSVHLILLGGIYLPEWQVVVGPQTIAGLANLHADKLFLGADGMTLAHGVTTANVLEAEVDRAMVRAAREVILVADSSKVGGVGLTSIMPLTQVHKLITDEGAPQEFVSALRDAGVEVILV
ncbi:MAG: DeoR/GlpR family DNA-binding transcription regulator [Anaerolineae bacterium]|nr:DeoR/GlpR family DNA-binding transcription regulator [Anaerolineae bacterium]